MMKTVAILLVVVCLAAGNSRVRRQGYGGSGGSSFGGRGYSQTSPIQNFGGYANNLPINQGGYSGGINGGSGGFGSLNPNFGGGNILGSGSSLQGGFPNSNQGGYSDGGDFYQPQNENGYSDFSTNTGGYGR